MGVISIEKTKKEMIRWLDYRVEGVNGYSRGYYYVTPQIYAAAIIFSSA